MPLIMYRIFVTKLSSVGLKHNCCSGPSRLYKSVRQNSSKTDKKPICPPPHKKRSSGAIYTIGVVTLLGGGTIAYAKYDPKFREWLDCKIPYSDSFIKFLFQEEKTYLANFVGLLDAIKESFLGVLFGDSQKKKNKDIQEKPKNYIPPTPAFLKLAEEHKEEQHYAEIRVEKKHLGEEEPTVIISGEQKQKEERLETHPKSIAELEAKIGESAKATVEAYNKAVYALKNYNQDIQVIIEDSVDRLDPKIWESMRQKSKAKDQSLREAQNNFQDTRNDLKKMEEVLNNPSCNISSTLRQQAELNMVKVQDDIEGAKRELEQIQVETNLTDKYWKKVEDARSHFIEEIEILFPGVNISERKLNLQGGELDLFILHAFSNVLYYQKELCKLEILEAQKLKVALETARRGNKEMLTEAQINQLVEKEKRQMAEEFQKKCLALRIESEKELRRQLKIQSETFSDHLTDALKAREKELERDFARHLNEKITAEKCKFKLQLSALAGRIRGMDQAFKEKLESDKMVRQSQVLWSACQSLFRSLRSSCPGIPWIEQLRPLEPEIIAVRNAAAENDELVNTVLNGIPQIAKVRGVFSEEGLRERFLKVEKVARQLALVPEGGARLPLHILSYFHSLLLLRAASPIPQAELADEEVNFTNLNTNDVLQRARYWMDRGDFAQTLRYMNLLEGAPRTVARQWMEETRLLLETQQAANILMAHAAATGLLYL